MIKIERQKKERYEMGRLGTLKVVTANLRVRDTHL